MGVVSYLSDRLANVMSGRGTSVDRRVHNQWTFVAVSAHEAEAAYRSSWLMRKIIDVPPLDMTREWRDWQAKADVIEKLEAEEKRLGLKAKCKRALILSRLYGGGALILGTQDANPQEPLRPDAIRANGLTYVHVMSRHQLSLGEAIMDPASPWFGKPEHFEINAGSGQRVKLHPSRVVEFVGQRSPEGAHHSSGDWFWGDPLLQSIGEAVNDATAAMGGFASLIDEAKLDIIKIPGLMDQVGTQEYQDRLMKRLGLANVGKSTHRALIIDGAEEWNQRQVTWAGIPEVMMAYLNVVAGAADIPVTRLLGQSPKGLQSTGEGEERDYQAMVRARQDEMLAPALDRIDDLLLRSALGSRPTDVYYEFAPLQQTSPKEAAEIEGKFADVIKTYADTGLIPQEALAAMAKNGVIERGQFPGSETAFEQAEAAANEEPPEQDGQELGLVATREPEPRLRLVGDAEPSATPVINLTVPLEVHMPKGGTRTTVTAHTEDGRIAEYEQRPIEEE